MRLTYLPAVSGSCTTNCDPFAIDDGQEQATRGVTMKIGICGIGQFSGSFIPLYKAHPLVDEVVLCDLIRKRADEAAGKYGISRVVDDFDELIRSDIDAVVILTQRHTHAPLTLAALDAGKHVYCAVPIAVSLDEIEKIVSRVKSSGLIYMNGETSYYYPSTIYCRNRHAAGDFGDFVYAEAAYLHDMDHGFYKAYQYSGGSDWKKVAGIPPMFYPTHSVSMVLSVVGQRITHASCLGYADKKGDGVFGEGNNLWDNRFSNETALMRTSGGGMCRINEFRRVGWRSGPGASSVHMSVYGTDASFETHASSSVWVPHTGEIIDVTDDLTCKATPIAEIDPSISDELAKDFHTSHAKVHPMERLPAEFRGQPNGHEGSHQFLVDDFVQAVSSDEQPPVNVWEAAKYAAPGIVAHESAERDGEMLPVPDFGEAQ
jgi:predicted dehydrogenase